MAAALVIAFAIGLPVLIVFGFLYLNNQQERKQERWRVERKIDLIHTGADSSAKPLPGLPFSDSDAPPPTAQLLPRRRQRRY